MQRLKKRAFIVMITNLRDEDDEAAVLVKFCRVNIW